jgi:ubiquinone/menaquinone biosynthesis C-methylase UbiE
MTEESSYDAVADRYATRYRHELDAKPLDRALLHAFIELCGPDRTALVADVGCGPGQIARYLNDHSQPACGIDISQRMCEIARSLHPGMTFIHGSMFALPVGDDTWSGITAFYAICHVPRELLAAVFAEFMRTLRPAAPALLSFHAGSEVRHATELLGVPVDLDFHLHTSELVAAELTATGFIVEAVLERRPYEPLEVATRRGYILARKPG